MNSEWKEIIEQEMEREAERIMEEVNLDPALKDVKAPPDMYDELMKKIREYEKQKVYDQLSEEDRECLRIGQAYMRRRKLNRYIVLVAAVVFVLAFGTVSLGENGSVFDFVSRLFASDEQVIIDSDEVEPILYVDENEVYEDIEKVYGFDPVRLGYLPENTGFHEATFNKGIQSINIIYEMSDNSSLIYIIRPNYRDASFGTVIEDEKIQEYQLITHDVEVIITEYVVAETGENHWSVHFVYEDVLYMIRIPKLQKESVEKIVMNLDF